MILQPRPGGDAEAEDLLDDEEELQLPEPEGGQLDSHDPDFEPDDDEDLDLLTATEPESVGLDATTGLDEPEDHELATTGDDESERWTEGGEAAGELDGDDDQDLDEGGSEYGWTDGNDPVDDGGFDDGVVALEEEQSFVDDGGLEGLSDEALELEVDTDALPDLERVEHDGVDPLDEGEPDDIESFALEVMGEGLEDEETIELSEGLSCTQLPAGRVRVETLHRAGQPLIELAACAEHGVAFAGGTVLVAPAGADRADARYARTRSIWDLAAADTPAGLFVALASPDGLLCSHDGGRSFTPAGALPGGEQAPNRLALTRDGDDLRLWAAAPEGPLCASDDGGRSFAVVLGDTRVLRLASDGRRALLAVARHEDGAAVAEHTIDGGGLFESLELPAGEVERIISVHVGRENVLACRRAPEPRLLIGSAEEPWLELLPHAAPPATLVDEDGGMVAYCCASTDAGEVLLRRALDGGLTPQLVARLPQDVGAAVQLRGHHDEGVTTLQLGTERCWLRVTVVAGGRAA